MKSGDEMKLMQKAAEEAHRLVLLGLEQTIDLWQGARNKYNETKKTGT